MMAPPAHIRYLARLGFVSSSCAVVIVSFRARSPRREQRGGARRSRGLRAQLGGKPAQVRGHVDVVPGFGESHRQSERARVSEQRIPSVARAERRGADTRGLTGHGLNRVDTRAQTITFIREEEERLLFLDGAAKASAELIEPQRRLLAISGARWRTM